MTVQVLSKLGGLDAKTVHQQIRDAHAQLPATKCMAALHRAKFPSKEGGCDVHTEDT